MACPGVNVRVPGRNARACPGVKVRVPGRKREGVPGRVPRAWAWASVHARAQAGMKARAWAGVHGRACTQGCRQQARWKRGRVSEGVKEGTSHVPDRYP